MKPKDKPSPKPEEPEEEEEPQFNPVQELQGEIAQSFPKKSFIQLGDITIGSSTGLNPLKKMAITLLKNKQVRSYLNFQRRKKMIMPPSYTD